MLILLVQVHGVHGFTRVSVVSAEENDRDGNCGDRDLQEAAHLKRVVGVSFGRNSTDVLFEWAAKNFVLMAANTFISEFARSCPSFRRLRIVALGHLSCAVMHHRHDFSVRTVASR